MYEVHGIYQIINDNKPVWPTWAVGVLLFRGVNVLGLREIELVFTYIYEHILAFCMYEVHLVHLFAQHYYSYEVNCICSSFPSRTLCVYILRMMYCNALLCIAGLISAENILYCQMICAGVSKQKHSFYLLCYYHFHLATKKAMCRWS
jgi:hypothetical protein